MANKKNFYIPKIDDNDRNTAYNRNKSSNSPFEKFASSYSGYNVEDKNVFPYVKYNNNGSQYEDLKDIISMLGYDELSDEDQATVVKARQLERFLTQPFATTKHFTGMEGKLVDLDQTLTGCEEILSGKYLDVSPNAFYMIGDISEAKLNIKDKEDKE